MQICSVHLPRPSFMPLKYLFSCYSYNNMEYFCSMRMLSYEKVKVDEK